jgi:methionyl-tRNA synthetase
MSANIPLPKTVFAHGYVNDKEGKKCPNRWAILLIRMICLTFFMSIHFVGTSATTDIFYYHCCLLTVLIMSLFMIRYLCKETPFGEELSFGEESMRDMHNSDLCDTLGNLVNRATNSNQKFCNGVVADVEAPSNPPVDLACIIDNYLAKMDDFDLQGGANIASDRRWKQYAP